MARKVLKLRCIRKMKNLDPPSSFGEKIFVLNNYLAAFVKNEAELLRTKTGKDVKTNWLICYPNGMKIFQVTGDELRTYFIATGVISYEKYKQMVNHL